MPSDLEQLILSYIEECDCEMGVALHHIESGEKTLINADKLYPLASVVKVPILVEAFHQIADNRLRLDDRWTVTKDLGTIGSGLLPSFDNGLTPTVRDLLTLMIIISDNTATDMLFERLGVENVNRRMKTLGLTNIHVPHNLKELFIDMVPNIDAGEPLPSQPIQPNTVSARTAGHTAMRPTTAPPRVIWRACSK